MEIYIVQSGDTVNSIALENGVSVDSVIYNNQIEYPYALAIGQPCYYQRARLRMKEKQ